MGGDGHGEAARGRNRKANAAGERGFSDENVAELRVV